MQLFEQSLVPGLPGATTRVERAWPFTLLAFTRFGGLGVPRVGGDVSGEVSAWGRFGPLDGIEADGDVTAAWVQYQSSRFRARLGRQVTLPGSSRYVRFDGASLGVTFGPADLDAYAGWVALPRWSRPRGAMLAGFVTDALLEPSLVEAQNRAGQLTYGARAGLHFGSAVKGAVAYHEQRDATGVAYRVVSADARVHAGEAISAGGRLTFDTTAAAFSEAKAWVDVLTPLAPLSIDYAFVSPSLLLPQTSILAAFGGWSWHELGAEGTLRLLQSVKITGRASGQLYEGWRAGGRGSLKLAWAPGIDGRGLVLAEAGRVLAPVSGFTYGRLGGRYVLLSSVAASADAALYLYDAPVRGHSYSLTGIASLEWSPWSHVHGLLSGTVMTTPYSEIEVQALARLSIDFGTVAEGATP